MILGEPFNVMPQLPFAEQMRTIHHGATKNELDEL